MTEQGSVRIDERVLVQIRGVLLDAYHMRRASYDDFHPFSITLPSAGLYRLDRRYGGELESSDRGSCL